MYMTQEGIEKVNTTQRRVKVRVTESDYMDKYLQVATELRESELKLERMSREIEAKNAALRAVGSGDGGITSTHSVDVPIHFVDDDLRLREHLVAYRVKLTRETSDTFLVTGAGGPQNKKILVGDELDLRLQIRIPY